MDNILKAHNTKILLKDDDKTCNCRDKATCPVANKCLATNVGYKATVQYEGKTQHYIGMTENLFKTRYTLHKSSLRHSKHRNQTELVSFSYINPQNLRNIIKKVAKISIIIIQILMSNLSVETTLFCYFLQLFRLIDIPQILHVYASSRYDIDQLPNDRKHFALPYS